MEEIQRTPWFFACFYLILFSPERILEDTGGAYLIGSIGSAVLYTIKGLRGIPMGTKWRGISSMIRTRSPVVAGNFAMWGLAFSSVECTLVGFRKKEDPFNSILSGGVAGGLLTIHKGKRAIRNSAALGFFILAIIEGVSHQLNKMMIKQAEEMQKMNNALMGIPNSPSSDEPPKPSSGSLHELDVSTRTPSDILTDFDENRMKVNSPLRRFSSIN